MKSTLVALTLVAAPSLALAQPGAPTPAPVPAPAPGPGPAPAPVPPDEPPPTPTLAPPPDSPQWLPGVVDLTAAETAIPGKLTLTMARAVEIAEQQQPSLRQARAAIEAAHARVDSARVAEHPHVNVAATVSTGSKQRGYCDLTMTTLCGGFFSASLGPASARTRAGGSTTSGQTAANIRAAEANADAATSGFAINTLDVRRDVEITYLEALARKRLILVAEATVKSEVAHLDQARRFVAAQAKDPIEVAQAQARAANARSTLAQAQSNEAVALANLRAAIGWLDPTRAARGLAELADAADAQPPDLAELVQTARKNRPEIAQLDKQIDAAEASRHGRARRAPPGAVGASRRCSGRPTARTGRRSRSGPQG